jgi:hypothetical protein
MATEAQRHRARIEREREMSGSRNSEFMFLFFSFLSVPLWFRGSNFLTIFKAHNGIV